MQFGPRSLDELLQFKALNPLPASAIEILARIEQLDTSGFSEAEVRAYVIDPLVSVLGYEKGSIFSTDLEKKITFLDRRKFIDYSVTLWRANFWIIEAKRPSRGAHFSYRDFRQAQEYAVHPDVNAALIVLCDGNKIEVFDRETSVTGPVLRVERQHLVRDIDTLRILLEPWQIWFFEKRRVLRQIDKVFEREFNLNRVDEFRKLIERRLDSKRSIFLENYRKGIKSGEATDELERSLSTASAEDLIDGYLGEVRLHLSPGPVSKRTPLPHVD